MKYSERKGYVFHNQVFHSKNNFTSTPFPLSRIIPFSSFQKPLSTNSKFLSNFNYTLGSVIQFHRNSILSLFYLSLSQKKNPIPSNPFIKKSHDV